MEAIIIKSQEAAAKLVNIINKNTDDVHMEKTMDMIRRYEKMYGQHALPLSGYWLHKQFEMNHPLLTDRY